MEQDQDQFYGEERRSEPNRREDEGRRSDEERRAEQLPPADERRSGEVRRVEDGRRVEQDRRDEEGRRLKTDRRQENDRRFGEDRRKKQEDIDFADLRVGQRRDPVDRRIVDRRYGDIPFLEWSSKNRKWYKLILGFVVILLGLLFFTLF